MLRKSIPDIRYLRAYDPRIASQMLTLEPWQHVSPLPATWRDISVVLNEEEGNEETVGDRIRTALGGDADIIESVETLGRTPHAALHEAARSRLGTQQGQVNLLLRISSCVPSTAPSPQISKRPPQHDLPGRARRTGPGTDLSRSKELVTLPSRYVRSRRKVAGSGVRLDAATFRVSRGGR